ncbi:MAG: DUF5696 domain-containing protein [Oscillospiraceae bacterium]|nr:DUF5696 domain-containing protein [Oscillospiraceae bacterium]
MNSRIRCTMAVTAAVFFVTAMPFHVYAQEKKQKPSAENGRLAFYVDNDSGEIALEDKKSGYIWRSSPENAEKDTSATNAVIEGLRSELKIECISSEKNNSSFLRSFSGASVKVTPEKNGAKVTYDFASAGISLPVTYSLKKDCLEVTADISELKEGSKGKLVTGLEILGSFGAADSDDEGCFVIPDGSGALIRFNNGKTWAKSYSGTVYGRDIASVPKEAPDTARQVYFPVYGIVNGNNGIMAVCTEGDANAELKASVSGVSKSSYNICGFDFTLRENDTYYMAGDDGTALSVYEKGNIKTDRICLRYYPVEDTGEKGIDWLDIAAAYRDYLTEEMNVSASAEIKPELYIDLYGGTEKKASFLGFPYTKKTALTDSVKALRIIEAMKNAGAENLVVSYKKWTDEGIKNMVDTRAEPSSVIDEEGFRSLLEYARQENILIYPAVSSFQFRKGGGYSVSDNAAVRLSGEYARIYPYDPASGLQKKEKDPFFLLSPGDYEDMFHELSENCIGQGIKNISVSDMASVLYSDFGGSSASRKEACEYLVSGCAELEDSMESILADTANAYALPYVNRINSVPLSSGGYDIFDENIPFYQAVLHGVKSFSSEPVNADSCSREMILRATAAGCDLHYVMTGEKTSVLKGTELDELYYTYYDDWTEQAVQSYKFSEKILSSVSGQHITGYREENGRIFTLYEDGTEIITDLEKESVAVNGRKYLLEDYIGKGR